MNIVITKMTEDEFFEKFTPVKNHIDTNAPFDGMMFETYNAELEYIIEVFKKTPKRVWTILEADERLYYASGFHQVNAFGYFITNEETEGEIEVDLDDVLND